MKSLKPEELETFLQRDPVVVNVRPEAASGGFPGALEIPVKDIQSGAHDLPKDRPILLVCERGTQSELAGLYLEAAGYAEVWNLQGGLRKLGMR